MVINGSVCDRQSEVTRPHFPARRGVGSVREHGEEIARCTQQETAPEAHLIRAAVLLLCLLLAFRGFAQEPAQEYQIKAAFLFNFAKFVDWPADAFPNTNSPIVIGVLGKNVFGHYLQDTIQDKKVRNRSFEFKEYTSVNEVTNCHILFISPALRDDYPDIVKALHNSSVLTVSETDEFLKAGGMVNFTIVENKVHFEIADEAAKKAGLKISSKLLSLGSRSH